MKNQALKFSLLLVGQLMVLSSFGQSLDLIWAKSLGGNTDDPTANSIAVDNSGNVIVAGTFLGTVDFDPSSGITNLTSYAGGSSDIFISKYNSNGVLIWTKQIGGPFEEYFGGLVTDASDNIYFTGVFSGTVDFDQNAGVVNLSSNGSGDEDIFYEKIDANGNFVFAKKLGNNNDDREPKIAYDTQNDDIVITGQFQGTVDFDPDAGTTNLTSCGGNPSCPDVFIARYRALNGNILWAVNVQNNDITPSVITIDYLGNTIVGVYKAGGFPSCVKISLTGILTNISFGPSGSGIIIYSIRTDNNGNIYFGSNRNTSPQKNTIEKYTSTGTLLWSKTHNPNLGSLMSVDIEIDDANNGVYFFGNYGGTVDFSGTGAYLVSKGGRDNFILQLDTNGNFVDVKGIGGMQEEYFTSAARSNTGSIYICGSYQDTCDFDPSVSISNLISNGASDMYFAKYFECNLSQPTISQSGNTLTCSISGMIYQWYLNGNEINGATNQSYTATQNGNYMVKITDTDGCFNTSDPLSITIINGIAEIKNIPIINIYPNPFSEKTIIEISHFPSPSCDLIIYDVLGQEVLKQKIVNQKTEINRENLPSGIYFYQLKNKKGILANGKLAMQ